MRLVNSSIAKFLSLNENAVQSNAGEIEISPIGCEMSEYFALRHFANRPLSSY
jgi:hypothetical protein